MSRIWFDVAELFGYAEMFRRPSGIQRVVFELGQALAAQDPQGLALSFVRPSLRNRWTPVEWAEIANLFAALADEESPQTEPQRPCSTLRLALRQQGEAWRALWDIPASFMASPAPPAIPHTASMQLGDVLLLTGAGWSEQSHIAHVAAAKAERGVEIAVLIYDIIPLLRPEWCDPSQIERFKSWLDGILGLADHVLAISQATADDVIAYRARLGLLPVPVHVVRLGDGFTEPPAAVPQAVTQANVAAPYALFVSTIEIRKNHALLVEVWRRLIKERGAENVPILVFAGRQGALTGDLMAELRTSHGLDGRVIVRDEASDADIAALYRGCAFTLFPSLYEGWGLPVAESLALGKPCLASNSTSIPEVGGALVRYFDPLNVADCARCVAELLDDPAGLAVWQAEIQRDFQPTPWSATAAMVRKAVA